MAVLQVELRWQRQPRQQLVGEAFAFFVEHGLFLRVKTASPARRI
jgi:hypothetical protein